MLIFTVHCYALEVTNTAGELANKVTDTNVTTLKVNGTMDANDFFFIADNLLKLTTVDLTNVTVEPCHIYDSHYWNKDFAADEVPVGAFSGLPVTSVKLPAALKTIGKAAFAGCTKLNSITLPNTLDSIAEYAFAGCTSLTTVKLPASVRVVGNGAFMRCSSLTSLTVDSSSRLARLDATALMDCPALTTVKLGSALKVMGERALAGTGIEHLDLTASTQLTDIGDWAMVKTPIADAKLPTSVKNLGDGAFLYDTNLSNVQLSNNLDKLNDYVLAGTGLTGELHLNSMSEIGDYSLYNVSHLSVVELPASMTWLGTRSMAGMTGMTSLVSKATEVPALGEDVWMGVNQSNVPLSVPSSSIDKYKAANQWKEFLFEESHWLKGDVNGDGEVNIADVNMLVSIIQGYVADDATMMRADVNEDGEINITDVNTVITLIMQSSHAPAHVDVNDQLHAGDLVLRPGEQHTVIVTLDNATDYSGLQCDVTLPQGLTLVGTHAPNEFVNETCGIDDATSRTVVYSMDQQQFDDEGNAVLTLTVRADASLATESQILLSNIVIADGNSVAWHLADCVARVTNSTGIEDLSANADRVWVEGHTLCIETRHDGTAQVVAVNGMAHSLTLVPDINRHELEPGFYVVVLNGKSYKIAIK